MDIAPLTRAPRKPAASRAPFPWLAVRLLASILGEGIATVARMLWFPVRREAIRRRMQQIILRPAAPWALLAAVTVGLAGCQSTVPGSSFSRQVDETVYTLQQLWLMEDAQESLESDLRDIGSGTSLAEAWSDFRDIISSPDAQQSLEEDLASFGSLELDALPETFELLGW